MIKADIGVITNARPDHLDEMGPTEIDVVKSLCNSVPINGTLVTAENKHQKIIKEVTLSNNSKFISSNNKAKMIDKLATTNACTAA